VFWAYRTPVGMFWIKPRDDGRYVLGIGDDALGSYHSPMAAADDVASHVTGYYEWDCRGDMHPVDLSEWSARAAVRWR
jgi:hypothetical protein